MATVYKSVERIAAHQAHEATIAKAEQMAGTARTRLAQHRYSGRATIEVSPGRRADAFVALVDPAALSIEFGRSSSSESGAMQGIYPLAHAIGAAGG